MPRLRQDAEKGTFDVVLHIHLDGHFFTLRL